MTDLDALFAGLSREPDVGGPNLQAHDATDRLLLETVGSCEFAQDDGGAQDPTPPGTVVTIGDRQGALTLGAAAVLGATDLRVFQDPLLGERALDANARRLGFENCYSRHSLGPALLDGARLVLLQLPRSLAELDEIAQAVARWASSEVTVLAGGRVKHMSRSMNEVLSRSFGSVTAGLGRRKSRILTARDPLPAARLGEPSFPVWGQDPDLPFGLAAFGATFGGAAFDHGSRLLLRTLAESPLAADPERIFDLGCGNGALGVAAALRWPTARVIAGDQSVAAVAATRLTAEAAGVADRVEVVRADGAEALADGWADLVLLNPPFHSGATVHMAPAHRLIRSSARALAPGGELRLVFNSGLRYRPFIEGSIGPARQLARDRTFTVLSARRDPTRS